MYNQFWKRAFDFISAGIALIVFSPVMLVVAILIKLESRGPVFFVQQRMGQNNQLFAIYKFRSMRTDTPNVATDLLQDPASYITKTGRFLRKSSLDELPQLINVVKGEMSVVGPRPALYNQYSLIEKRNDRKINDIKPGLTGYAQVSGRDSISDDEKVRLDEHYLQQMSFSFDIKIIFITIFKVFKASDIKA
ncbi:O-antigen biosynthesis protein WbqP [Paenibacillus algorifonticola]|uniref:O-antigen biosynthesis protein WbqP n=1 Tax=Paenibacillus algorifonticola TaxID=684063 RepID=A0A1I2H789_9BACL|nr:sugar transferase [Paenibacillus algorifonticola]SFF25309.1 O-antigen biosynthesis protein WbqP [Paenibacillus algorifonticola]